jgi:hypothetical protein
MSVIAFLSICRQRAAKGSSTRHEKKKRYICVGVKEWKLTLLSASEAQGAALSTLFLPYVYISNELNGPYLRIEFKTERKNRGKLRNFAS